MKLLYIDCQMGAAGDMLMGALMELIEDKKGFIDKVNHIGIPGIRIWNETVVKCGDKGNQVHVIVRSKDGSEEHGHHYTTLTDIHKMIDGLNASEKVKSNAKAVYDIIAKAESMVHRKSIENVHFHEVGALDAVADVVGTCLLMEMIHADQILISPIHVGSGTVKCAHGILSVPTPATARILEGMPIYSGEVKGELCTPTGAALLKHFGDEFGSMPDMRIEKTGRGMGTKEFPGYTNGLSVTLGYWE